MSEWVGVITDAGAAAFRRCIASGETLNVNAVKIGTGIVEQANMRAATALVAQVGSAGLAPKKADDSGVKMAAKITPLASAYTIKEVGFFATVGSDVSPVMIALYQNSGGIELPSVSDFPDYMYKLNAIWPVNNLDGLTVTVDTTTLVSEGDLEEALEGYVAVNQGISNAGKFLIVGDDGVVAPVTVPFANGGSY